MNLCKCKSNKTYEDCCQKLHNYKEFAKSPMQLMRSRYCAYALGLGEYLYKTTLPSNAHIEDIKLIEEHNKNCSWLHLEILKNSQKNDKGFVEFKAYYLENEKVNLHHELSDFKKIDKKWYYENGKILNTKIERNRLCPCGSGKKFKRCHLEVQY